MQRTGKMRPDDSTCGGTSHLRRCPIKLDPASEGQAEEAETALCILLRLLGF